MRRSILDAMVGATIAALVAGGLSQADSMARAMGRGVRLPGRSISVTVPRVTRAERSGLVRAGLEVKMHSAGPRSLVVARSDFTLSAGGDMFAARGWDAERSRVTIASGKSRAFRLSFRAPGAVVKHAALFYRSAARRVSGAVPLTPSAGPAGASDLPQAMDQPVIKAFPVTAGIGEPWGTATDSSGNIWFAEPGCDFAPSCSSNTPPGQIGRLDPSSGAVKYYPLPGISGNQPIFLAFDGSGDLWFTTPNNSMIGEFRPSTETFIGQWPVTAGSGPWGLAFANGQIWYTEHFASAIGRVGPPLHDHQDFPTPSANSNPYGITANGDRIWFTENNSDVDRVAVLDTANPNAISEYPIVRPLSGTPHLIATDANGRPWWTEGFSNTIATLDPAAATPGSCGTSSGVCTGVHRFQLPASSTCGGSAHTSGIAFQASANLVWLDNSLTAEVGSFTPSTGSFNMHTLGDCGAHPHDGLSLDASGNVWFDEEFANAIGELVSATGSATGSAPSNSGSPTETGGLGAGSAASSWGCSVAG